MFEIFLYFLDFPSRKMSNSSLNACLIHFSDAKMNQYIFLFYLSSMAVCFSVFTTSCCVEYFLFYMTFLLLLLGHSFFSDFSFAWTFAFCTNLIGNLQIFSIPKQFAILLVSSTYSFEQLIFNFLYLFSNNNANT